MNINKNKCQKIELSLWNKIEKYAQSIFLNIELFLQINNIVILSPIV